MLHDVLLQSRLWGNNPYIYIYIYRVFQSWDASLMFSKHKVGNKIQDLMFTNFRLVIQNKRFLQPCGHQMGSPKWDFDVGSFVVVPNMGLHQKKLPKSGWMGTLVSVNIAHLHRCYPASQACQGAKLVMAHVSSISTQQLWDHTPKTLDGEFETCISTHTQ